MRKLVFLIFGLFFTNNLFAQKTKNLRILPAEVAFSLMKKDVIKNFCQETDPVRSCALISKELCEYQIHFASVECETESQIQWISEENMQLLGSAFGPCVTRKFVVQNKSQWRTTASCENWMKKRGNDGTKWITPIALKEALAKTPAGDILPLDKKLALKFLNDLQSSEVLYKLFLKNSNYFCPSNKGPDQSTCAKTVFSKMEINSAGQIPILISLTLMVMNKDVESGFSKSIAGLMAAENILTIFEAIKIDSFHVQKIVATNSSDKKTLNDLKKNEAELLKETSSKVFKNLAVLIEKARTNRDPASYDSWKSSKLKNLSFRLENLKTRNWSSQFKDVRR